MYHGLRRLHGCTAAWLHGCTAAWLQRAHPGAAVGAILLPRPSCRSIGSPLRELSITKKGLTPALPNCPVLMAPSCSCGCGRICFEAYVKRGQAARIVLLDGAVIQLARTVECTRSFLSLRPDLCDQLRQHLLTDGKHEGRGSGSWKRVLEFSESSLPRPRGTLDSFAEDTNPRKTRIVG